MSIAPESAREQRLIKRIVVDGSILSGVLGSILIASLYYNPEIWHDDYPAHIREKARPMSDTARKQRRLIALSILATALGIPTYSNLRLKRQNHGELSFKDAFINAYGIGMVFNVFDLLVLDYLLLLRIRPRFAMLPGTEDTDYGRTFLFHFGGFLKGVGYLAVVSLLIAFFTSRRWMQGRKEASSVSE